MVKMEDDVEGKFSLRCQEAGLSHFAMCFSGVDALKAPVIMGSTVLRYPRLASLVQPHYLRHPTVASAFVSFIPSTTIGTNHDLGARDTVTRINGPNCMSNGLPDRD